jgi:glycerol kinase
MFSTIIYVKEIYESIVRISSIESFATEAQRKNNPISVNSVPSVVGLPFHDMAADGALLSLRTLRTAQCRGFPFAGGLKLLT